MGKNMVSNLLSSLAASAIMLVLAIIGFFIVVFVVKTGSELAGYQPSGDFVVLSSAIITAASTLSGFLTE